MEAARDLKDRYRDLFLVSLGRYGRVTQSKSLPSLAHTVFESLKYAGKTLRDMIRYGHNPIIDHPLAGDRRVWLMVGTRNNLDSLNFIREARPDCQVLVFSKDNRRLGPFPRFNLAPQGLYWWKMLWLLPAMWKAYGNMVFFRFDAFLQGLGCYERALGILSLERPRALIFANDHSAPIRAFAQAGRQLGIPVLYLQHASVSPFFPPLIFDLSLLEGRVALETYRRCGPVSGRVELVGMPKFDPYHKRRNEGKQILRIGVCTNMLDNKGKVLELLNALTAHFPHMSISYRAHPRDTRRLPLPEGVRVSETETEGIFDFLTVQDLIIAGDTSTHLEATLLNVSSLYYPMGASVEDYYGFVANGVVERMDDLPALMDWIKRHQDDRPPVYQRAKPYHALVGTPMEGKSRELALRIIDDHLNQAWNGK